MPMGTVRPSPCEGACADTAPRPERQHTRGNTRPAKPTGHHRYPDRALGEPREGHARRLPRRWRGGTIAHGDGAIPPPRSPKVRAVCPGPMKLRQCLDPVDSTHRVPRCLDDARMRRPPAHSRRGCGFDALPEVAKLGQRRRCVAHNSTATTQTELSLFLKKGELRQGLYQTTCSCSAESTVDLHGSRAAH